MSSTTRRRRGQALAEFALAFPIMLLAIIGLVDIGRLVFTYNSLTNAVREGARLAIVNQDLPSVEDRVLALAAIDQPVVTVDFWEPEPNKKPTTNAECDPPKAGCIARVNGRTDFVMITPLIGRLIGPITITAESQFPVDFVCPNPTVAGFTLAINCPRQP
jgi:hypothetical protein